LYQGQSQGFYTKKLWGWGLLRGACALSSIGAPFPVCRSEDCPTKIFKLEAFKSVDFGAFLTVIKRFILAAF